MSWQVPFTVVTVTKLVDVPDGAFGAVSVTWSGVIAEIVALLDEAPVGLPLLSGTKLAVVPLPVRNPVPESVTFAPAEPEAGLIEAHSGCSAVYSKMSLLPAVAVVPAGVVTVT